MKPLTDWIRKAFSKANDISLPPMSVTYLQGELICDKLTIPSTAVLVTQGFGVKIGDGSVVSGILQRHSDCKTDLQLEIHREALRKARSVISAMEYDNKTVRPEIIQQCLTTINQLLK